MHNLLLRALLLPVLLTAPLTALSSASGTLDSTFDDDGRLTTAFDGLSLATAQAVTQQPDGKLLVAGSASDGSRRVLILARHNDNGSLDDNFSDDGGKTLAIGSGNTEAAAVALQSTGKIVTAGFSTNSSEKRDFTLARFTTVGALDTSFGSSGITVTSLSSAHDEATAMIALDSNHLIAAGYSDSTGSNDDDFALVAYTASGALDTSFGNGGKVTTDIAADDDIALALLRQPDGKLLLAGSAITGNQTGFALARYSANGALDSSFSGDGKAITLIGSSDSAALAVLRQSTGKIVVAGYSENNNNADIAIARYNSNGTLDTSFSNDGLVVTALSNQDDVAYAVFEQFDGKLLVAGYTPTATTGYDFALLRYNSDGSLDTGFSGDGIINTVIGPGTTTDTALAALQQTNGELVLAGSSGNSVALARYLFDDDDSDSILDDTDNCQFVSNVDQANHDTDDNGDACDDDDDNDGVTDTDDAFPLDPTESLDTDNDGIGNNADTDDDNDSVPDVDDPFPLDPYLLNRQYGGDKSDSLGYAVTNAGDIDGDGYDDVLVGAPMDNVILPAATTAAADVGSAFLYSGKTMSQLASFHGTAQGDAFGSSVAVADVNNDNTPDLIIGAPKADKKDPVTGKILRKDNGAVHIYSGADFTELAVLEGSATGDAFGSALAGLSDIDSDTVDDLLVGAPRQDVTDNVTLKLLKDAGAVHVYSGQSLALLTTLQGTAKGDYFGAAVAGNTDLDHDNSADIVIGAYRHDPANPATQKRMTDAGRIYVFAVGSFAPVAQIDGSSAGDQFGFALVTTDTGADSFADLLASAPGADVLASRLLKDAGKLMAYTSASSTAAYSATSSQPQAGAQFGYSLSAAGDIDNDGIADAVAGSPKADITANTVLLKDAGMAEVLRASDGRSLFTAAGKTAKSQYGLAVSGGGDHNQDGYSDIIIGTPAATNGSLTKAGIMEVLSGKEASGN